MMVVVLMTDIDFYLLQMDLVDKLNDKAKDKLVALEQSLTASLFTFWTNYGLQDDMAQSMSKKMVTEVDNLIINDINTTYHDIYQLLINTYGQILDNQSGYLGNDITKKDKENVINGEDNEGITIEDRINQHIVTTYLAIKETYLMGTYKDKTKEDAINALHGNIATKIGHIKSLVITSGTDIYSKGLQKVIKLNTKMKFVAVLDSKTTKGCRHHNGTIMTMRDFMDKGLVPPLHINCRSTLVRA